MRGALFILVIAAVRGSSASALANGCRYVYVDLGTNIGHQIRKLFEPALYQENPTERVFAAHFPQNRTEVCAFGFEANPIHSRRLSALQRMLQLSGARVSIFTETAVSTTEGSVTFHRDPGAAGNNEWGAGITTEHVTPVSGGGITVNVSAVDFPRWFQDNVIARNILGGELPPAVVLKSDIEGHDMTVLSGLILRGAWCAISEVYGEHITEGFVAATREITSHGGGCLTKLTLLDDESGDDAIMPKT